jgi:outer membrane protein assembly factor BamE
MKVHLGKLLRIGLIATALGIASGCIYRMPVQQGNFLKDKELDQVQVGMTRTQVRYLLGTPMVADPFENTRWDYVYTYKQGVINKALRRHFIVHFEGDKVVKIEKPTESAS